MQDLQSVDIVGVPIYNGTIPKAIETCSQLIDENTPNNNCISLTGAHGVVTAQKEPQFKELLNSFFLNLPDGMPNVWVSRLKGGRDIKRCYGPDFFKEFMKASANSSITHFLCGGKEGVAVQLEKVCSKKFDNNNIVGTFCPPFLTVGEYDYECIADKINKSGADVVWIGISTPKQEQFASRLSEFTDVHFLITVGAAFDFHIGNVRQAPEWMQKNGLEWFFRLLVEPKRLWRRYLEIVPLFLYYSSLDIVKHTFKKRD